MFKLIHMKVFVAEKEYEMHVLESWRNIIEIVQIVQRLLKMFNEQQLDFWFVEYLSVLASVNSCRQNIYNKSPVQLQ